MADAPHMKLVPEDDYMHEVEDVPNYNESMYFNIFDHGRGVGGWFRLGNRPNEGHAEMSCCVYLPDGRVGFMFKRDGIDNNDAFDAGGMKFQVVEPHARLKVEYEGKLCVMENPHDMADPSKAFKNNPIVPCSIYIDYEGVSAMMGGEPVNADGSKIELDAEKSFARGHTEQHMKGTGHIRVGDELFEIDGLGLRDHSWGPRYWQNIYWYRWCPFNLSENFAMMLSITCGEGMEPRRGGVVMRDGEYEAIEHVDIETDWDENWYQRGFTAQVRTKSGEELEVKAEVMSLIPLRNRRRSPDGDEMTTRITEGMTRYTCNGETGYGLSEFLDQINDDGLPVSIADGTGR